MVRNFLNDRQLSRREFLAASAATVAAASLGSASALFSDRVAAAPLVPTIPPSLLGLAQFSLTDATGRLGIAASARRGVAPTMGRLGGPNYPEDPADLGPLVPLPGGFAEVFDFLADAGIAGFQFFNSTQNVNELGRQPTAAEIRGYLDAAGLVAFTSHQLGIGLLDTTTGNLTSEGEAQFDFLSTLGMDQMGFSGNLSQLANNSPDPANPSRSLPASSGWLEDYVNPMTGVRTFGFKSRAQHCNRIGEILRSRGVRYFYHPEQDNYRFFNDPAHPELDTVHRIQYVMQNTDPNLFGWLIDAVHNWSGRLRFLNAITHQPDISLLELCHLQQHRVLGWHLKDGNRNPAYTGTWTGGPAEGGGTPYNQTYQSTPTFTDAIPALLGDAGAGPGPSHPNADPDCPGFKSLIDTFPMRRPFYTMETDSGPGGTADPGRSLRWAKASAKLLLALRSTPPIDISGSTRVKATPLMGNPPSQFIAVTNLTNAVIPGPVSVVLDGLSAGVTLLNRSGSVINVQPTGAPFMVLTSAPLAPGQSAGFTLQFASSGGPIGYNTRVLAGPGLP